MAINRKGSRRVVVDDVVYRWTIRRKPSRGQAYEWSPLRVAISPDAGLGTTLVVEANGERPDAYLQISPVTMTPATIAATIRAALASGWRSTEPGPPFHFKLEPGPIPS